MSSDSMVVSTTSASMSRCSVLAASAPVLEHALGRDEPLTPGTGDELAGEQRGATPATLGGLLSPDPRRPDSVRALPAGLRDDLRQQLLFADRPLVVRSLHDQPVFHHGFPSRSGWFAAVAGAQA